MAKFCTNCGKKLEEGKTCSCKKETKEVAATEVKESSNKKVVVDTTVDTKEITNNVLEIVKGIFTKPVETCKKYATVKNIKLGYILLALSALASALFITFTLSNTIEDINDEDGSMAMYVMIAPFINDDNDGFEAPLDKILDYDEDDHEVTVNTTSTFIYSTLIVLAESLLLIGSMYLVHTKFMKKDIDFKKVLVIVSLVNAINIAVMFGATALSLVLPNLVLFLLTLGSLYFMVTLYQVTKSIENLDENKYPLMFTLVYAILSIVVYILIQLI